MSRLALICVMFKKRHQVKPAAKRRHFDDDDEEIKVGKKVKIGVDGSSQLDSAKQLLPSETKDIVTAKDDDEVEPEAKPVVLTTTVDYQPDVCKDFWQTGYCGYGDTCKFLHIRDELRQKVPVKKDWQVKQKTSETPSSLPFKCILCKDDYKLPVLTECHHLFCKQCYRNRYHSNKTCAICHKDVLGVVKPVSREKLAELLSPSPPPLS